jgi:ABC-type nickel/cobalt efflux system permease component RcnA
MRMLPEHTRKKNKSKNLFFRWVANFFVWLSRKTGKSYNEMNVVVYFGIIPFSWALLLDFLLNWGYFSIGFVCFTLGVAISVKDFNTFADNTFRRSVEFLLFFNRYGSTYERSSVLICALLPIMVYILLIYFVLKVYFQQP